MESVVARWQVPLEINRAHLLRLRDNAVLILFVSNVAKLY